MGKFLNRVKESLGKSKLKLNKKSQLVLAGILALVMVIIFINGIKTSAKKSDAQPKMNETETTTSSRSYEQQLEQRLEKIISSINGVGEVSAFVMTETSVKTIYAGNEEIKTNGENSSASTNSFEIVFEKNGTATTPIVSLEIYPEITGVLIVAEGVNDEKLRLSVINAVSVALSLENSKIEVLTGKKTK